MIQSRNKARAQQRGTRKGNRNFLIAMVVVVGVIVAYYVLTPVLFPKAPNGPSIGLNPSSDIPGAYISITGRNLTANQNVTATIDGRALNFTNTCATDSSGNLVGCTFVIPHGPSGKYNVTATDGTHSRSATLTIPSLLPPYSTLLVTVTSVGLGLLTQLVTRRVVDLNAERRMKAEVNAFNKEKREATLANDKAKLEKLKKRDLQVKQESAKISTARLKVTVLTIIPLFGVYYLMATFLGGYGVIVGYIPIPIPYVAGAAVSPPASGWQVSLFWWYFISSFTFSSMLTRLLHTST